MPSNTVPHRRNINGEISSGNAIHASIDTIGHAVKAANGLKDKAILKLRNKVRSSATGGTDAMERFQHQAHGLAWIATYAEALEQIHQYLIRLSETNELGELEILLAQMVAAEYFSQIIGGIPMSQLEFCRPDSLELDADLLAGAVNPETRQLVSRGNTPEIRRRIVDIIIQQEGACCYGKSGLEETFEVMRNEIRKFVEAEITPKAHGWHLANAYIPMEIVSKMVELGVFSLTIPEEYGGLGLGKEAMCVISEELSRGYIGVGSLGTRSEIASELILSGGTEEQKKHWLPKIADGEVLPTAVFTEPNTGSDLASLQTRAVRDNDHYLITGQKTWITHAVRADLMTLLARTDPSEKGHRGLSMFLAEKPRGTDNEPFPAEGMSGSEIEVLGYRGMKEFDISFDQFKVKKSSLLGGEENQGFKQLMRTFESARIQTAARAVGVAQNALDLAIRYAQERIQFSKQLHHFPRVSDKIAMMAAELLITRQLTYHAAREKDLGRRSDQQAGMAKLLAARNAWAAADNALQIHGGNGFALEYPVSRVLCDARILNIFEGAGEIQAQIIARRLLEADH